MSVAKDVPAPAPLLADHRCAPGRAAKVTLADNTAAGRSQSRWLATFGPPPGQPGERALNRLGPSSRP
jgi:hypothetical protein